EQTVSKQKDNVFYFDEDLNAIYKKDRDLSEELTRKETELLKYLITNSGKICKRDEIAQVIWGSESLEGITDEAIDQVVSRLRSKIEDSAQHNYLTTIRGIGFKFNNWQSQSLSSR
ncbi:winged helix-turn-helix transcriptional regulator, partial [candidate division WWE3 bacterium]|nr:winged helix-turn-helix transcriptional regulator [candidate division WWE3 bacterium]